MKFVTPVILIILLSAAGAYPETISGDIPGWRIFVMDQEGYIYIDGNSNSINKYSPKGKFILKIGEKGEGPSNIKRLGWFALHPESPVLYVTEYFNGNKWISKFSTNGKYMGEWKCELDWKKYEALSFIKFDNQRNIYLQAVKTIPRRVKDFTIISEKVTILKFSPDGKKLNDLYEFTNDSSAYSRGKGDITIPFKSFLSWNLYEDGLIVGETNSNVISIFSKEGKPEKKITLPFERQKVTEDDIAAWKARLKEDPWVKRKIEQGIFDIKYWRSRLPIPEYKALYSGVGNVDSRGNLYIKKNKTEWLKINLSTGGHSTVTLDQKGNLFLIDRNYFFFWEFDKNDELVITKIDEQELYKKVNAPAKKPSNASVATRVVGKN